MALSGIGGVTVSGAAVALHAGLNAAPSRAPWPSAGEFAGVVALASVTVSAMVTGRSWPSLSRLYSWRHAGLYFQAGDTLCLSSHKAGTVLLWPLAVNPSFFSDLETTSEHACRSIDSPPAIPFL